MTSIPKALLLFCIFFALAASSAAAQMQTGLIEREMPLSDVSSDADIEYLSRFYGDKKNVSWSLYVPRNYDPQNPPGVIVFISPTRSGEPRPGWLSVLEDENMIYISANNAGNRVPARKRIANAVFALNYVHRQYKTDPQRTIIAGFSGGARMTSTIVEIMPDLFSGAIFMGGAFGWAGDKAAMPEVLAGGTYVFITGRLDSARYETRRSYWQFRDFGNAKTLLIDSRYLAHEWPRTKEFRQALEFSSRRI